MSSYTGNNGYKKDLEANHADKMLINQVSKSNLIRSNVRV